MKFKINHEFVEGVPGKDPFFPLPDSRDIRDGAIYNGFDYELQVWIVDGIIQDCGHPRTPEKGHGCCNARRLHGRKVRDVQGREVRL